MKMICSLGLCLSLLIGCSNLETCKQQKPEAYASLSKAEQTLVDEGRIEQGMDTNAVLIAWGKPSVVMPQAPASGLETNQTWIYYGNRPVMIPRWVYIPNSYGRGTLDYSPDHYSERYIKARVYFKNDRVVNWWRWH